MIIAVASGKGGTGKTTISVALSLAINEKVKLLDCDVEEPNAKLFIDLGDENQEMCTIPIPNIDQSLCTFCGKCQDICQFNAITVLDNKVLVFDELCHSCGGCDKICPYNAVSEYEKPIGTVINTKTKSLSFVQGKLDVGNAMSPPLIRAVKSRIDNNIINIIDCPPGNSCPVITAVNGADYIVLVTEASPFGLNDLKISVDTIKELNIPFGIIINRTTDIYKDVSYYCSMENIKILLEIPENLNVAKAYSKGDTLLDAVPEMKGELQKVFSQIKECVL